MAKQPEQHSSQTSAAQGALFDASELEYNPPELLINPFQANSSPQRKAASHTHEIAAHADTRERALGLLSTLDTLAQASENEGLVKALRTSRKDEIQKRIGRKAAVDARKISKDGTLVKAAMDEFLRVYNLGENQKVDKDESDFLYDWVSFKYKYGFGKNPEESAHKRQKRNEYRKILGNIATQPGEVQSQTEIHYRLPAAPDKPYKRPQIKSETQKSSREPISYTVKQSIAEIRRAEEKQFIPTTGKELKMIEEIEQLQTPRQYLTRILRGTKNRALKKAGVTDKGAMVEANAATTSIINTMIDFQNNATESHGRLKNIEQILAQVPAGVSLARVAKDHNLSILDVAPVVRFSDFKRLLKDGIEPPFSMLLAHENRTEPSGTANKVVEDSYAGHSKEKEEVRKHIVQRAMQLSVGEVRFMLAEAKLDQSNRHAYWKRQLDALSRTGRYSEEVKSASLRVLKFASPNKVQ